jgi:hypothetical protein
LDREIPQSAAVCREHAARRHASVASFQMFTPVR